MLESFWNHSGTVYDHLNHPDPFLCNSNSGYLAYGNNGTDMDKKFHCNIICITGKCGNYLNAEPAGHCTAQLQWMWEFASQSL